MEKNRKKTIELTYAINKTIPNVFICDPPLTLISPSYLPKLYNYKELISGLMPLAPQERLLLTEESTLGIEFRKTICSMYIQVAVTFLDKKYMALKETLSESLTEIFQNMPKISMSKPLEKIIGEKLITYYQHLVTFFWHKKIFTYEDLCFVSKNKINCDSFKGYPVKILSFIELELGSVLYDLLLKIDKKYKIYLVNPEGSSQLDVYYNPVISFDQAGQKHADLMICIEDIKKYYYDIKSYIHMSVEHRRFFTFISNEKLFIRLINDLTVSWQKIMQQHKANKVKYEELQNVFNKIIAVRNNKKTKKEIFSQIMHICITEICNGNLDYLNISLAYPIEQKIITNPDIQQILDIIQKATDTINLEKIFPQSPQLINDESSTIFNEVIEAYFPKELQETFKLAYKKMLMDGT